MLLLLRISPDALRSLLAILVQSDAHTEPITYSSWPQSWSCWARLPPRALCTLQPCSCPVATLELVFSYSSFIVMRIVKSCSQPNLGLNLPRRTRLQHKALCKLRHAIYLICDERRFVGNDDLVNCLCLFAVLVARMSCHRYRRFQFAAQRPESSSISVSFG